MPELRGQSRSAAALAAELTGHLQQVREIYERVVHAQKPASVVRQHPEPRRAVEVRAEVLRGEPTNLVRFLDQRAPGLAEQLGQSKLRRGHRSFEHFLEKVSVLPERLDSLNTGRELASAVIDLFECSPYFAEQLIRAPDLMEELKRPAAGPLDAPPADPAAMRRYFQRHMMRIQAESICHSHPIFDTLIRTSDLADRVIAKAYQTAIEQVAAAHPPKNPAYVPRDQLMVIALGRLGMREFDLASDADLNFILAEEERPEIIFWTRVAERMIDVLAAYTGEGAMFAVDTRLRPSGREGALVQTDAGYRMYFEKHAEAWEGLASMKARAVAGNLEAATCVLGQIQETDWRRWGQAGSRRELRGMRMRVEREQGGGHPLKAGVGGYYDIDFILMYLRLKGGGIFYRVLNTPQRIHVLETMGQLDPRDASFLRDAATFFRAIDHGLRLYSGHAEGNLPNSEAKLEALTELVARWTPPHLKELPLQQQLESIKLRTRELFERYFPVDKESK
jgi:[glutamine synthetase] adenylyltransferase / [glutamine synthetase]-adenylyl-L-tyrosine phosphorylase